MNQGKQDHERNSLVALSAAFLRLGATAFGGPAAHTAMMEDEFVSRKGWITKERLTDMIGVTNLIPGPNSTELAMHIGYDCAGWRGLIVAGLSFIVPAIAATALLAWIYTRFGALPHAQVVVEGMRAGAIAVIAAALLRLGKPIVSKAAPAVLGATILIAHQWGANEILLLFGAGAASVLWTIRGSIRANTPLALLLFQPGSGTVTNIVDIMNPASATMGGLFFFFLKIGSILYGSGYVLLAFIQGGLVDSQHWISRTQLLDAVSAGQFTPGPVLSTATFVGYLILGVRGAAAATVGIFLPSFVFMLIVPGFIDRIQQFKHVRAFLDGVNVASIGLMASVFCAMTISVFTSPSAILLAIVGCLVLFFTKINPAWVVLGGGIVGLMAW